MKLLSKITLCTLFFGSHYGFASESYLTMDFVNNTGRQLNILLSNPGSTSYAGINYSSDDSDYSGTYTFDLSQGSTTERVYIDEKINGSSRSSSMGYIDVKIKGYDGERDITCRLNNNQVYVDGQSGPLKWRDFKYGIRNFVSGSGKDDKGNEIQCTDFINIKTEDGVVPSHIKGSPKSGFDKYILEIGEKKNYKPMTIQNNNRDSIFMLDGHEIEPEGGRINPTTTKYPTDKGELTLGIAYSEGKFIKIRYGTSSDGERTCEAYHNGISDVKYICTYGYDGGAQFIYISHE